MEACDAVALPNLRIGEIVLRTSRYDEMRAWYRQLLAIDPYLEHAPLEASSPNEESQWATQVRLCFYRLWFEHPYQQVVAIFESAGAQRNVVSSAGSGLHHVQLGDLSVSALSRRHLKLKALDIVPFRAMDHGPTTSFYYHDPDQNVIEIAAPNYARVEDFLAASQSREYRSNPSGRPVNPDAIALGSS